MGTIDLPGLTARPLAAYLSAIGLFRVVASQQHPCRPCGIDGCGGGKVSDCLASLTVEEVLAAAHELLAR